MSSDHEASVLDHRFGASDPYTLGVEEEYMLLDPETWDLVQHIEAVLQVAGEGEFASRINAELMQSVVEVTTPVCHTPAEAGAHLRNLRSYVAEVARSEGCRFASAGTHPFSLFERQRITARDRYHALVEQMQYIGRGEPPGLLSSRQMVFSAFPRSGVPPRFASYDDYAAVVGQLERTGAIADY